MVDDVMPQDLSFDQEEWRPIPLPGLDHYEASSCGRIRSLDHEVRFMRWGNWNTHKRKGAIRKLTPCANEFSRVYYRISFSGGRIESVHRLICATFHGHPPSDKHQAAHLDGNSINNRSDNLVWATATENGFHRTLHGTSGRGKLGSRGGLSPVAKLTDDAIPGIFEAYLSGWSAVMIGRELGVSHITINFVLSRRTWLNVEIDPTTLTKVKNKLTARHGDRTRK